MILDRLLNKEDFTEAFDELQKNHQKLGEEFEKQKRVNQVLASDLLKAEKERDLLKEDPEQYIEQEVERRLMKLEKELTENMNHKWYCIGRQDAYAQMGIRVIQAHQHGCDVEVKLNEDGSIDEVIEPINEKALIDLCNELEIDDLEDVS